MSEYTFYIATTLIIAISVLALNPAFVLFAF